MAVKTSSLGDISFRSSVGGGGGPHGGPYRYYRIVAVSNTIKENAPSTAFISNSSELIGRDGTHTDTFIKDFSLSNAVFYIGFISMTEAGTNTVYPTSTTEFTDTAVSTSGGITVSAGYFRVPSSPAPPNRYAPYNAFSASGHGWWTNSSPSASVNYLQIDFGAAKNISKFTFQFKRWQDAGNIRILASNDANFTEHSTFAQLELISSAVPDNGATEGQQIELPAGSGKKVAAVDDVLITSNSWNIYYDNPLAGGIEDEFGEGASGSWKPSTADGFGNGARYFGQTYLSGFYSGLTRNVTDTDPKFNLQGFVPYADQGFTVYDGPNGAFYEVSSIPYETDSWEQLDQQGIAGRSSKFKTIIDHGGNTLGANVTQQTELLATASGKLQNQGNLKNMFIRQSDDVDSGHFISGSIHTVYYYNNRIYLLYYLSFATSKKLGPNGNNIETLPSVSSYGAAIPHSTSITNDIWYSDRAIPMADVPPTTSLIGNAASTAAAIREYVRTETPGRFGIRHIPRNDGNFPELKFSDFSGAKKKPEIWEVFSQFYISKFRTFQAFATSGTDNRTAGNASAITNSLSESAKFSRAMMFYSFKVDPYPAGWMGADVTEGIDNTEGVAVSLPNIHQDGSGNILDDKYALGAILGSGVGRSKGYNPREDLRDYETTTVLINLAQVGIGVLTGEGNGLIDFAYGNVGGLNDTFQKFTDTNTYTAYGTDGLVASGKRAVFLNRDKVSGASLENEQISALTGWYAYGLDTTVGGYPSSANYSQNITAGGSIIPAKSHWYAVQLPIPPSELASIRVRASATTAVYRANNKNVFILPGKWDVVDNTFKHASDGRASGDSPSSSNMKTRNLFVNDLQQNVNYGDIMFHSMFQDYENTAGLFAYPHSGTTVDTMKLHELGNYQVHQRYSGGNATRMYMALDTDNPSQTGAAGTIKIATRKQPARGTATYPLPYSVDAQSFVMRCVGI